MKTQPGRNGGTLLRPEKGETLNPNGRPRKLPGLNKLLAEIMSDESNGIEAAKAVLMRLRQKAIAGDLKAIELLLDRAYGKPKQHMEIEQAATDLVDVSMLSEATIKEISDAGLAHHLEQKRNRAQGKE